MSKINAYICLAQDMYKNIQSSTIGIVPNWRKLPNSPLRVEWTLKLWYIYIVVYKTLFIENESTLTTYTNMDESHKHNIK